MEPKTLDHLARLVGSGQSRRRVLKSLAGGALGAIAASIGIGGASARALRSVGNSCASNADCASGLCVQEGRTRKICHCQAATDCPGDACHTPICQANGSCTSTAVICTALDACHTAGVCDPQTGVCSNPVALGATCDDGDACTSGTTCQADGSCGGGTSVCCTPPGGPCTISNFVAVCCHNPDGSTGCEFPTGDPQNGVCFLP
jgi:hypothetical protein